MCWQNHQNKTTPGCSAPTLRLDALDVGYVSPKFFQIQNCSTGELAIVTGLAMSAPPGAVGGTVYARTGPRSKPDLWFKKQLSIPTPLFRIPSSFSVSWLLMIQGFARDWQIPCKLLNHKSHVQLARELSPVQSFRSLGRFFWVLALRDFSTFGIGRRGQDSMCRGTDQIGSGATAPSVDI